MAFISILSGRAPFGPLLMAGFFMVSAPASAADRDLKTVWMIEDGVPSQEVRELRRGDFVFKQRLLPFGLAEIAGSQAAVEELATGIQLVEIQSPGVLVFCDPVVRAKKLIGHAQPCLVDADGDGRFEGMFLTSSVTKGLLTIQGNRPKNPKPIDPLPYRRIDPREFKEDMFVGVQYRGDANLVGNHVFEINFGNGEQVGKVTDRFVQKKAEVPGSRDFLGGRFTILEAAGESIRVRVDRPLPSQPFALLQTTTYRFY